MQKITPENIEIQDLKKGDIFVFGSNLAGIHGAGAARFAYNYALAEYGKGTGLYVRRRELMGSYAIPTKGMRIENIPLDWVKYFVDKFIEDVKDEDKSFHFYVTKVGCGLAGFTIPQIAPLFQSLVGIENVSLPQDFIDFYAGTYVEPEVSKPLTVKEAQDAGIIKRRFA